MIAALTQLLLFQLAGELIVYWLGLAVPGPVIGMLLLVGWLVLNEGPEDDLRHTGQQLLQHLSLLFVPAGVGVMLYLDLLREEWLPILVAVVVSTFLSLIVTALVLHALTRRRHDANSGEQA